MRTEALPRAPARGWSSASCCGGWRRSSTTGGPGSRPTGWGSGGFPRTRCSRSAAGWPPFAGSPTATSGPPTPTGPTRCSRWRTGARRRSATRSSTRIADEHGLHGDDRAVLYSSTEFKKVRLRYFTDDYARLGAGARGCLSAAAATRPRLDARHAVRRLSIAARWAAARRRQLAGPRDAAIGRDHPIFVERGEGFELIDVDGNRYVDWVCSWGPLILGHAHPDVVDAVRDAAERGTSYGAPTEGEVELAAEVCERFRVGGDGADGQLGHRGVDERAAPGAGGDRPRRGGQVRRRLPRPRRRPARRGRLGAGHAGHPGQPGGDRGAGGRHDRRPLERPRGGRPRRSPSTGRRRSSPSRSPANMGVVPPADGFLELPARAGRRARRPARPRRGDHGLPGRPRRRPGALRGRRRPDDDGQGARAAACPPPPTAGAAS